MKFRPGMHINLIEHFRDAGTYVVVKEFDQEQSFLEYSLIFPTALTDFDPKLFIHYLLQYEYIVPLSQTQKWDLTAIIYEGRSYTPEVTPEVCFVFNETDMLINSFAEAMRVKLKAAEIKYGYTTNWMNPNNCVEMNADLNHHLGKGDPVDVANYAAFLWYHNFPTSVVDSD